MLIPKKFFGKSGSIRTSAQGTPYVPISIYADNPESQIVLTTIVGYTDEPAPQLCRIWTVSKRELETEDNNEVRFMESANAGAITIKIDNDYNLSIGSKIYIRSDRDGWFSQHITNVLNKMFMIPGPGVILTIEDPLPYDFDEDSRVFVMERNNIHFQPQSAVAGNSELTLTGECLTAGPMKSPLHAEVYGADGQLHIAGYWIDRN